MKKIIIAFDGKNYPSNALEFARLLNEHERLLVTGIFAPNTSFAGSFVYPTEIPIPSAYAMIDDTTLDVMEINIRKFENFCLNNGLEFRIHKDNEDLAVTELRHESRFADLMLLNSNSLFSNPKERVVSGLFNELMHISECPVMVIPPAENTFEPREIVLAYDGSEDSVFAIKQFTYLCPALLSRPCMLVYINPKTKRKIPDLYNIEELCARHFQDLTIEKLEIPPRHYFATWLGSKKFPLLVAGSFGRSFSSRIFKESFVTEVMEYAESSIFLAHK